MTIPSPNWAQGSRTEGHYTDTTARYVKRIQEGEKSRLCTSLSSGWLGRIGGHARRGNCFTVGDSLGLNTDT
jgi:hypothetical protein